jgi:2-iminobutanoate/2-iminopropanoate deaminase
MMPDRRTIHTDAAPKAVGPYSQAVISDGWLFTSGQVHLDPSGNLVEGDIGTQTRQALENLRAVLSEAGATFADVVKVTVYLRDMGDFEAMNQVYAEFFAEGLPARSCVEVSGLPVDARVEIDLVARLGN